MYPRVLAAWLLPSLALGALTCTSQSQPNPIKTQYANQTTGTINGTIAILPIEMALARSIIPSQYPILTKAIKAVFPHFPADMYPAMLQTEIDHDVGMGNTTSIPDFSRASISFPFVDRLNDGYTSMTYGDTIAISADNLVAIAGTTAYGNRIVPATFDPPCDAYAAVSAKRPRTTYFNAFDLAGESVFNSTFIPVARDLYTLKIWKNITNQPQFSNNPLLCDNYIRLFNSSVTRQPYEPTPVVGTVSVSSALFKSARVFKGVRGLRLDNAFIEKNFMSCESLQGYSGTGSGD